MPETLAPAPPGVQSTQDGLLGLGPKPSKGEHANKFRKAFAELTQEDVKPKEQAKEEVTSTTDPVVEKTEQVTEPSKDKVDVAPTEKKPESPLDAVLAKTPKEEKPVEEPDVLKEFDEKTANWQRAREVMKTQSGELKTLREKVKSLETAPKAEPSVIEELTKQRDELQAKFQQQEDRLKAVNYRFSDEYQSLIKDRENVLSKISSRVKSYGGDEKGLLEAVQLPEGKVRTAQIKEALAEVDPEDKPRIYALIEQLESHDEKLADAEKNSTQKWDELSTRTDAQRAEQVQAAIKQLETEFGKVAETIPVTTATLREVPDDVPGAEEWNKEIRSAQKNALRVLKPNGADFNESVAIAMKGARYDSLEKRYLSLHTDYSELKQKYNEAVGSGPDFKGGSKTAPETQKKPGMKYREAYAIAVGQGAGEV